MPTSAAAFCQLLDTTDDEHAPVTADTEGSSKSIADTPRRVLHFLFGPFELPDGLHWRWRHAIGTQG